ncbi:unnamed protein product [Caenorhabditis sp. 36 PRJEB53466]|nr:unnamed protein product [Caenorhabditis sp. 36 PRJEB53466]
MVDLIQILEKIDQWYQKGIDDVILVVQTAAYQFSRWILTKKKQLSIENEEEREDFMDIIVPPKRKLSIDDKNSSFEDLRDSGVQTGTSDEQLTSSCSESTESSDESQLELDDSVEKSTDGCPVRCFLTRILRIPPVPSVTFVCRTPPPPKAMTMTSAPINGILTMPTNGNFCSCLKGNQESASDSDRSSASESQQQEAPAQESTLSSAKPPSGGASESESDNENDGKGKSDTSAEEEIDTDDEESNKLDDARLSEPGTSYDPQSQEGTSAGPSGCPELENDEYLENQLEALKRQEEVPENNPSILDEFKHLPVWKRSKRRPNKHWAHYLNTGTLLKPNGTPGPHFSVFKAIGRYPPVSEKEKKEENPVEELDPEAWKDVMDQEGTDL